MQSAIEIQLKGGLEGLPLLPVVFFFAGEAHTIWGELEVAFGVLMNILDR